MITVVIATLALAIGWLIGNHEQRVDEQVCDQRDWYEHYQQALWVARRTIDE